MKTKQFEKGDLVLIETTSDFNYGLLVEVVECNESVFDFKIGNLESSFLWDELIDNSINLTIIEKGAFK